MTIEERVAKGVEFLDSRLPDWWQTHSINLDKFHLAEACNCVIGQVAPFPEFDDAIDAGWLDLDYSTAYEMGFFAGHAWLNEATYDELTAEWRRVITSRREATDA